MNYNKKYQINSRYSELILKQKSKMGIEHSTCISNVEAENIIIHWANSDNIDTRKYTLEDKSKLLRYIYEITPNNTKLKQLEKVSNNIKSVFDKSEIDILVKTVIAKNYKPGIVISYIRSNNDGIIDFMSQFDNIKMVNGIIINKKFIGDMLKLFDDIEYNKETGEITDKFVDEKVSIFIDFLIENDKSVKYDIIGDGDIYIISIDNNEYYNELKLKFDGLKFEKVPFYYFNWK